MLAFSVFCSVVLDSIMALMKMKPVSEMMIKVEDKASAELKMRANQA